MPEPDCRCARESQSKKTRAPCGTTYSKKTRAPCGALRNMAEWTGLEPATPGVTGRYSNQLNYHSKWSLASGLRSKLRAVALAFVTGDPKGIRTPVTTVKGSCPRPLDDRVSIRLSLFTARHLRSEERRVGKECRS